MLALLLAPSGCLDGEPLVLPDDAGTDAGGTFDADLDGNADKVSACRDCYMGIADAEVTCAAQWLPCGAEPKCADTLACALTTGCLAAPLVADIVTCGTPCAVDAGIFRTDDPAVLLILPLLDCVTKECRGPCQ